MFKGNAAGVYSRTPDQCNYSLVLATLSNRVYEVNFERHYLQKGHTIHVLQSDPDLFEHLGGAKIRCLEQIHDFVNKRELFVIGCASYVPPQPDNESMQAAIASSIEGTLTFQDEERTAF